MASDKRDAGWSPSTRRAWGVALVVASLFLALSLYSYDWRDIGLLRAPPNTPPVNLIGPLGAALGFGAFSLFGVGAYLLPVWVAVFALLLVADRSPVVWPRALWLFGLYASLSLGASLTEDWWIGACHNLNIADAGGVAGYLIAESVLVRWLSPVGAGILIGSLFAVSAVFAIGGERLIAGARAACGAVLHFHVFVSERVSAVGERRRADTADDAPAPRPAPQPRPKPKLEPDVATPPPKPKPKPETVVAAKPSSPRVIAPPEPAKPGDYQLPPITLLDPVHHDESGAALADTETTARILVSTLAEFGIEAQVTNVEQGPVVTRYELLPAPGIRVERIAGLANNLSLSLKATSVRVQAPIPGKGVVGVEVPNETAKMVYLREVLEGERWKRGSPRLPLALGKDVGGNDVVADLARMPHVLIAGATGSGKTVCMNAILAGLLMSRTPDELRLILVDPKIVEFSSYNHLPHLVIPVVTDPKKVAVALRWAITEMERRYKQFAAANVRNIESFNSRVAVKQEELFDLGGSAKQERDEAEPLPDRVPYIVIVIDELADLMLAAGPEIENHVARLAQLSRAVGIHMIIATQRPSVNVITGTIKANFPARIAFQVAQKVDSRTILDTSGADTLLGRGDMLFLHPSTGKLIRGQGAMVTDNEINNIVEFIRRQATPTYDARIGEEMEKVDGGGGGANGAGDGDGDVDDELLPQAVEIIRETRRASTSALQRRLRIGYNRAGRLMDVLEKKGIVGPPRGSDPREILIDLDADIPDNAAAFDTVDDAGGEPDETEAV